MVGRSAEEGVTARRRQLGMVPRGRAWTAGEDALLRVAAASGVASAWVAARLRRAP